MTHSFTIEISLDAFAQIELGMIRAGLSPLSALDEGGHPCIKLDTLGGNRLVFKSKIVSWPTGFEAKMYDALTTDLGFDVPLLIVRLDIPNRLVVYRWGASLVRRFWDLDRETGIVFPAGHAPVPGAVGTLPGSEYPPSEQTRGSEAKNQNTQGSLASYRLVMAEDPAALCELVDQYLAKGWRCLGGVTALFHPWDATEATPPVLGKQSFAQAMLKTAEQRAREQRDAARRKSDPLAHLLTRPQHPGQTLFEKTQNAWRG